MKIDKVTEITVCGEIFEYRSKTLILRYIENELFSAHWNGYISISQSTVDLVKGDYMHEIFDRIEVHGGVTYLEEKTLVDGKSKFFIGFDTAHEEDYEDPKSKVFVLHECQRVADQLIELGL